MGWSISPDDKGWLIRHKEVSHFLGKVLLRFSTLKSFIFLGGQ